jgi:hypothetical protein
MHPIFFPAAEQGGLSDALVPVKWIGTVNTVRYGAQRDCARNQTPVAEGIGIGPETRFTGKINKVTLEVR